MNTVIIETVRARNGRLHPVEPVPADEAARVRVLVHELRCAGQLSIRQVQRHMLEDHGLRRSTGRIHAILVRYECGRCADGG